MIEIGSSTTRKELQDLLGEEHLAQSREGIYNCKKSNRCLLFVNLNKDSAKESLKFDDYFQGEVFHWDSQPKQSFGVPSIQAMVNGDKEVHLFARIYPKLKSKTQPYIYCGSLSYDSYDEATSRPVHLMFRANDMRYDLPEDHPLSRIYHWKPSHEGQQGTYGPTVEVEKKKGRKRYYKPPMDRRFHARHSPFTKPAEQGSSRGLRWSLINQIRPTRTSTSSWGRKRPTEPPTVLAYCSAEISLSVLVLK